MNTPFVRRFGQDTIRTLPKEQTPQLSALTVLLYIYSAICDGYTQSPTHWPNVMRALHQSTKWKG